MATRLFVKSGACASNMLKLTPLCPLTPHALLQPPPSLGPNDIQHLTGFAWPVKHLLVGQRELSADDASSVLALCERLADKNKS